MSIGTTVRYVNVGTLYLLVVETSKLDSYEQGLCACLLAASGPWGRFEDACQVEVRMGFLPLGAAWWATVT